MISFLIYLKSVKADPVRGESIVRTENEVVDYNPSVKSNTAQDTE